MSHKDDMICYGMTDSSKSEDTIGDDDVTHDFASESIKSDFLISERQS